MFVVIFLKNWSQFLEIVDLSIGPGQRCSHPGKRVNIRAMMKIPWKTQTAKVLLQNLRDRVYGVLRSHMGRVVSINYRS